jgi:hypothetical protein
LNDFSYEQASQYWRGGQPLEAGRLIFESLPMDERPRWAGRILEVAVRQADQSDPAIEELRATIRIPSYWSKGHRVFSALRVQTLKLEGRWWRTARQNALLRLLYLAENVAKVVYNATDPTDEFDEDSGAWVVVCLKNLVDFWADEAFSNAAWDAVCVQTDRNP